MATHRFSQVDVFSPDPLGGNPVAVVHDARDLGTEQMQRFAAWTNLSETTFLLPPTTPDADYRVRIFTTAQEFPFAGHPTLGTARAWLAAGGVPHRDGTVVQECGIGLVEVRRDGDLLTFEAPPLLRRGPVDDDLRERLATGLGAEVVDAQHLDNGPGWVVARLATAADVLAVRPRPEVLAGLTVGVVGAHPAGHVAAVEVRAFDVAPDGSGFVEDPVTGSLNAGLGQWLEDLPARYVATQGTLLGRSGRVHVHRDREGDVTRTWVGGATRIVLSGTADL